MYRKSFFISFAVMILVVAAALFSASVSRTKAAGANQPVQLHGWAWSSSVGWLSFNSADISNSPSTYAVSIDSAGNLFGYAWSSNVGWVSFNGDDSASVDSTSNDTSGCPYDQNQPSSDCQAMVNKDTGVVSGWGKVLTTGDWLELTGTHHVTNSNGTGGVTYVSSQTGGNLVGFAWGGPFGWINFNESAAAAGIPPGGGEGGGPTGCSGGVFIGPCPSGGNSSSITLGLTAKDTTVNGSSASALTNVPVGDSLKISWNSADSGSNNQTCVPQGELASASSFPAITNTPSPVIGSYQYTSANYPSGFTPGSNHTFTLKCSETANSSVSQTESVTVGFSNTSASSASLTVTCGPAFPYIQVNQPLNWNASASGGTSPYTYSWTFTGPPASKVGVLTSTPITIYTTGGEWGGTVTATDSKGNTGTCSANINVVSNPIFIES